MKEEMKIQLCFCEPYEGSLESLWQVAQLNSLSNWQQVVLDNGRNGILSSETNQRQNYTEDHSTGF